MPSRAGSLETCGFKQRFWSLLGLRPKVTRARGRGTPLTGSMAERRTGRRGRRPLRVREGGGSERNAGGGAEHSPVEEGDHCSLRALSAAARVGAEAIRCGTFLHRNCNRTKGIPKTIGFWRRFCSLLPPWAKGCRAGARNIPLAKEQEAGRRGRRPLRVREGGCSERNAPGGAELSSPEAWQKEERAVGDVGPYECEKGGAAKETRAGARNIPWWGKYTGGGKKIVRSGKKILIFPVLSCKI